MPGRTPMCRLALLLFVLPVVPAAAAEEPSRFVEQVRAHFSRWDGDDSGDLSVDEIERAVHDPRNRGEAAAAVVALRRAVRADKALAPIAEVQIAEPAEEGRKRPAYEAMFRAALAKISKAPRRLFTDDAPKVESVAQGRLGDCFLLVSLGTCAARQPERLRRMMEPAEDDRVRVTLGDGRSIVVPWPTDAEVALGASTSGTGLWANVYEVAIGTVLLERSRSRKSPTPLALIGGGGTPSVPLALLTGHEVRKIGCAPYRQEGADLAPLREALRDAFAEGRLVVGGCGPRKDGDRRVPGTYFNHSYGVIDYDPEADAVTFWNPMGNAFRPKGPDGLEHGYATSRGRFRVPLAEAVMWFGAFSFETDRPADGS